MTVLISDESCLSVYVLIMKTWKLKNANCSRSLQQLKIRLSQVPPSPSTRSRHGKTPQYLVDCCTPVTNVVGRQRLRLTTQQMMVVPRHQLSTVGRRAFTVQGPILWNSSLDDLRAQHLTMSPLDSSWKPGFSLATSVLSTLETSWQLRYINSHLSYHTTQSNGWKIISISNSK